MVFISYLKISCFAGPLRLSCVLLANYVPKCQMNSGPYGPIFFTKNTGGDRTTL